MSTSMILGMFDWIGDFFKALFDLIPKVIYLLYASLACVLDVLQLFFRKLAGLDVYYIEGETVTGDLVTNFIAGLLGIRLDGNNTTNYSTLTTVFWAFIIFGLVICFASTLIAIFKSHYSYDEKAAKGPMQYVYAAGKAVLNMAAVPIIVVLGLYLSQAVLTALDSITSIDSGSVVSMFGEGDEIDPITGKPKSMADQYLRKTKTVKGVTGKSDEETYIYYDIFGYGGGVLYGNVEPDVQFWTTDSAKKLVNIGAKNQTFSGSLFKVAAYNANRARMSDGGYMYKNRDIIFKPGKDGKDMKIFSNAENPDELADMIDMAFACNFQFADGWHGLNYAAMYDQGIVSLKYFTNFLAIGSWSFSKFNVGVVWYFYDLWNFNFIVGFGAVFVCTTIFINIILGLITRLFMCVALFLVAPPLFGLAPLDGGGAAKKWRESFMKQVLMTYGAVVGMNIMFLLLPYINRIDFFNIPIADYFAQVLIIITGLITIKALIQTMSSLIGAEDANKTGEGIKEEVGSTIGKATALTAKVGVGALKHTPVGFAAGKAVSGIGKGVNKVAGAISNKFTGQGAVNSAQSEVDSAQKELENARNSGDAEAISSAEKRMADAQTNLAAATQRRDDLARKHNQGGWKALRTTGGIIKKGGKFAIGYTGRTVKGISDAFSSTIMGDKGLKAIKESIWKPEDNAKITAERTGEIADVLAGKVDPKTGKRPNGGGMAGDVAGMRAEMNTGLTGIREDMNGGFSGVNNTVKKEAETTRSKLDELSVNPADSRYLKDLEKQKADLEQKLAEKRKTLENVKKNSRETNNKQEQRRKEIKSLEADLNKVNEDIKKYSK